MFEDFEELLARKNQRFICCDTGWPEPGPNRHTAHIRHLIGPPLDEPTLRELQAQIGNLPELLDFYRLFGAARLYCDTIESQPIGYASAYYVAPPTEWRYLRDGFEEWMQLLSESEKEEHLPKWIEDYVVIGEVPNSGNYFLMPLCGEDIGKVFEFEHDGFEFIEAGTGFADFLNGKSIVTDELLQEILVHTRYSDGVSDTQWLCESYQFDPQ